MFDDLSKSEYEIMEVFWNEKNILSVYDIEKILKDKSWSNSTILTFLTRMVDKGLISFCKKKNRISYYEAIVSRHEYKRKEAKKFLDEKFHGSIKLFLVALTNDSIRLSSNDIKELDDLINKKEED